ESFVGRFDQARQQAKALGVKLHVGVHLGEGSQAELEQLAEALRVASSDVSQVLMLNANGETYLGAQQQLIGAVGGALIGLGNDTNFVDLNRNRPRGLPYDVAAFAIN